MIEVAESNAAYYYHYDGLGSVVALSDSSGDTVQKYQYTVFGEVWVSDIDHPNPYMFAGVRFDIEIGLYYNRARYYNPYTGRFLQTDPAGDGMNLYAYCGNSPIGRTDPSGCHYIPSIDPITLEERGLVHIHVTIPSIVFFDPEICTGSDEQAIYVQLWLRNTMGIENHMPGWNVREASFNSVFSVDVVITSWYSTWVKPLDPPSFRTETVSGVSILVMTDRCLEPHNVAEFALLDDRLLYMIMADQFNEILSTPRGQSISHYINLISQYAHTPFRQSPDLPWWSYYGTIYHNSEVNYIGFGFASAHFYCLAHTNLEFRAFMRFGAPDLWNLLNYTHFAGNDRVWYYKGYNWYPYSKYEPWWELFIPNAP
jgi:RHS repeat-associated protein